MSKWAFLKEFAEQHKGLPKIDIARKAKETFQLGLDEEQLRKIISREMCKCTTCACTTETEFSDLEELVPTFTPLTNNGEGLAFKEPGMYVVLGCLHVPGHNKHLVSGIAKLIKEYSNDIKGLALIGDFLDLNSLSGHDVGKFTAVKGLNLDTEYRDGNAVLDELTSGLSKKANKAFIYGNHEDRWNRYMSDMQKAKAPVKSPAEALKLAERGFFTFTNWKSDFLKLGTHLELIHGQYFNTHCAKQHIDRYRGSVMFAHTHRIQSFIEGSTGGFNIGWLGDINSPLFNYMERGTKTQWQNGFAIVNLDEEGNYYVQQVICHNDRFIFNNKKYGK